MCSEAVVLVSEVATVSARANIRESRHIEPWIAALVFTEGCHAEIGRKTVCERTMNAILGRNPKGIIPVDIYTGGKRQGASLVGAAQVNPLNGQQVWMLFALPNACKDEVAMGIEPIDRQPTPSGTSNCRSAAALPLRMLVVFRVS